MKRRLFEASEEGLGRLDLFIFLCVKILGDHCGGFGGQ
jgi:hypothetical protein